MKPSTLMPLLSSALFCLGSAACAADSIHLEAESGQLIGTQVETSRRGFSGSGYVGGFDQDADTIRFTVTAPKAGLYQVEIRYHADSEKGYGLVLNGASFSGMFKASGAGFTTSSPQKLELKQGANTLSIEKGWGYYELDALDFTPATANTKLVKPPLTLADKKANAAARGLMRLLVSQYGEKMLSGQYEPENAYVKQLTGKTPAIYGADLIEYSPSRQAFGSKPKPSSEEIIQNVKAGQIVTLTWHWNAPAGLINANYTDKDGNKVEALWWSGFYTKATHFDVEEALSDPQAADYKLLLRDIDVIAEQLKKFQAAGVPVLWRPLHEASGGWFWWGAKGPKPFKALWRLMFDRLTNHHQLHNLIWVFTGSPSEMDWYPGDDVVDVLGIDSYPTDRNDPLSSTWDECVARFGGRKLIALTEFKGVPDVAKMRRYGVRWGYFVSWTGDVGTSSQNPAEVKRTYADSEVVSLDKLKR